MSPEVEFAPPRDRLGVLMLTRLLLICSILAISSLPARAAEQRLPAAFTDDSNHIFLKVSINGAPEAWMLLDTGTVPSTIDRAYAQSLGLRLGKESNTGKGAGTGPIVIAKTKVQSLRVGQAVRQNVAFESMVFSFPTPDGQKAVGVLGYSFLAGRVLVVDYPRREVLVTDVGLTRSEGLPFRMVYNIPTVRAALGGQPVDALIDTGGYYDVLLTPPTAMRLGLEKAMADGAAATGFGYGGAQDYKLGKGPDLAVGDLVKPGPAIAFIPLPIKIDGALGTVFLKDYRMTIDYPAKRVLFER